MSDVMHSTPCMDVACVMLMSAGNSSMLHVTLLQVKKLRRMLAVFTLQDQDAVDSFDGSP